MPLGRFGAKVISSLSELLRGSSNNQNMVLRFDGFTICGYLLRQASPLHMNERMLKVLHILQFIHSYRSS